MSNTKHVIGHGFARSDAVVVRHAHTKSLGTSVKRTKGNGFFNPGSPADTRAALNYQQRNTGTGR